MRQFSGKSLRTSEEFFTVLHTTPRSQVATMVLKPGQASGEYGTDHAHADQVLFVIQGKVECTVNDQVINVDAGGAVLIEAGEPHRVINSGNVAAKTLNVYGPPAYPADG